MNSSRRRAAKPSKHINGALQNQNAAHSPKHTGNTNNTSSDGNSGNTEQH